ncbi:hypothetical protein EYZ11_010089 [Aspergillus tanneri]|uniref:Glutathione S-transferase n=1 Tax=Aspergillus tanneri TaxID=1220188 RepID=A0A4S3J8D9_9EURO|nr:uncharacterized protein ATNIH1004_002170 [Aspergillus tanneri]KAA8649499.1 hypothetical protein ATNIH1004_002170 [Aspergillus tanneri]THC90447.1 hypothetical protein EYZ11_010089 [Aspergillus tanneri]
MPQIKLFYIPDACSLAPHILLHEIGADYEPIRAKLGGGFDAHFREGFTDINPKMRVPVLSLDDQVITELPAVATAISSLAPEAHLMGKTTLDTIRVYEWMNYLSGTLHATGFGLFFRPHRWTKLTDEVSFAGIKERALEKILECFGFIEERLEGVHAVGGAFTAVDTFLYALYRSGMYTGVDMLAYTKYTALVKEVERRPAALAALKIEQIDPKF